MKSRKSILLVFIAVLIFTLFFSALAYGVTDFTKSNNLSTANKQQQLDPNDPLTVIYGMVEAIDNQDPVQYSTYFTRQNQIAMEAFLSQNANTAFFKEKAASLVKIKELPSEIGRAAANISESENLNADETRVFYTELKFKVDKQDKWLYNGVNYRKRQVAPT